MPFAINADGSFPEIGQRYDIGIATRDGTSLSCLNKDGVTVPVSRMAYMLSIDKNNKFKESTELQEKQKLIQLGTSTAIDREFDQWVQNTQGDWSGGIGQRVYGQQGVSNAYFDGEGLLWPINDWVPQVALRGPTQGLPSSGISGPTGPDFATLVVTPGGSAATSQAYGVLASFVPSSTPIALVGVKGAFTSGTNTAVTPAYGQGTTAGNDAFACVTGQRQQIGGSQNLGDTGGATYSWNFSTVNTDNIIADSATYTVPAGGIFVNSVSIYMGGYSSSVTATFCVWNASTGALITQSNGTSIPKNLALRTLAVNQTFIAAGTVVRIGFFRPESGNAMWGVAQTGSFLTALSNSIVMPSVACGSPYTCGHLQAYLTYTTSQTSEITTAAAGWFLVKQQNSPDGAQAAQIWKKENIGAAEVAPTFTAAQGARTMHAQLAEFTKVATSASTDQTGGNTSSSSNTLTITNGATDTVAGDLVISCGGFSLNSAATASFSDTMNNNITPVHLGDSGASSLAQHSTFDFGIVPTGLAAFASWPPNATMVGGWIEGIGMGYAVCYLDNQGPPGHWHAVFFSGDQSYDVDLGANTGSQQGPLSLDIDCGYLWVLLSNTPNANTLTVHMCGCAYGSNTFVKLRSDALPVVAGTSGYAGQIKASYVGGHLYVGVVQADQNLPPNAPTANRNALFVADYSAGTGSAPSGITTPIFQFPFERGFKQQDMTWQGSNLIVTASDGYNAYIYQLPPPYSTITTLAVLEGIANALVCTTAGATMIVAWTPGPSGVNRMELYILDGTTLTAIPFTPIVPFLDSVTSCAGFGPYALWAVSYATPGGTPQQKTVTIYAFDVVRSRLFRAITFTDLSWTGSDVFARDIIGLYGTTTRTLAPGAVFQAQLGLAVFSGFLSNSKETAREFYWGINPLSPTPLFTGLLQMGVDIISGLFDFTAATNKRFRAKVAHYIGGLIAGVSTPFVQLNGWLNQDPSRLNPNPDFFATTGTPSTPLPTDLYLYEGTMARQTVYEAISSGGGLVSAAPAGPTGFTLLGGFTTQAGAAVAIPVGSGVPVGDLVTVTVAGSNGAASGQWDATSTFSDSRGNIYVVDAVRYAGGGVFAFYTVIIGHAIVTTALQSGDTISFQGKFNGVNQTNTTAFASATDVGGFPGPTGFASARIDQSSQNQNSSTAAPAAPAYSVAQPAEVTYGVVLGVGANQVLTPNAGWTLIGDRGVAAVARLSPIYHTSLAGESVQAGGTTGAATPTVVVQVSYTVSGWANAPKLKDVVIMASSGMAWDGVLNVAQNVKVKGAGSGEFAYSGQTSPGDTVSLDHVAAYNFFKQLWKQRGGVCTLYLPNGESYPALMQMFESSSPQPLGSGARSDEQASWQTEITFKIREDV